MVPVTDTELTDSAMDELYEAVYELLNDEVFTGGSYEFLSGVLTLENDTIQLIGSQCREITATKFFNTPVLA